MTLTAQKSRARRTPRGIAFSVVAVLFGLATGFGIGGFFALVGGWVVTGEEIIHRNHDISWGIITGVLTSVPFFAMAFRPDRMVAAVQQVLAVSAAFLLGMGLLMRFDPFVLMVPVMALIALALYPKARQVFDTAGLSRRLATLAVAGGVPLLLFAWGQFGLQRANLPGDEHAEYMHYAGMGILAMALFFTGLIASLKKPGWRVPLWTVGLGTVIYGIASVAYPADSSSGGLLWGTVAILGGLAFIAAGEVEASAEGK